MSHFVFYYLSIPYYHSLPVSRPCCMHTVCLSCFMIIWLNNGSVYALLLHMFVLYARVVCVHVFSGYLLYII